MKKFFCGLLLVLLAINFTACVKMEYITIEPPTEPKDASSYTIMMYGCGGRTLDQAMVLNIQEALLTGTNDRVQFTGQIKFSDKYQQTEVLKGTQRFIIGSTPETWYTPVEVLDSELPLYDPDNLADFINWSKQQCPADEYILLLWNHGKGWLPAHDAPKGRAILYDDVLDGEALSLGELVEGVKRSNTHFKMIYFDACLMGMIEVMADLRECADYTLSASHVTPGLGGDYSSLIYQLTNSVDFEQAMAAYCHETVSHWIQTEAPLDLKLVDLRQMDHLLSEIKVFSGYLEEVAQISSDYVAENGGKLVIDPTNKDSMIAMLFMYAVNACYHYDVDVDENGYADCPFYDILSLAEAMTSTEAGVNSYTARFVDMASRLNRAFDKVVIHSEVTPLLVGHPISLAASIVNAELWVAYGYSITYSALEFDRQTNWGKWLSVNPFAPLENPNPAKLAGADQEQEEEGDEEEEEEEEEEESEADIQAAIDALLDLIGKR